MKTNPPLLTREELLALEEKHFHGGLGNLLSLGAAHFRTTNRRKIRRPRRNGVGKRLKAAAT